MMSRVRLSILASTLIAAAFFSTSVSGQAVTEVLGEKEELQSAVTHLWTDGLNFPIRAQAAGLFLGAASADAEPAHTSAPVLEPASLLLLATGFGAAASFMRRRLRHATSSQGSGESSH